MKQAIGLLLIITLLASCDRPSSKTETQKMNNDMECAWKLISGTTNTLNIWTTAITGNGRGALFFFPLNAKG